MPKLRDKISAVFQWWCVINHPARENASKGDFEAFFDVLTKYYNYGYLYATIIHDRDIHEDGSLKAIHMHLYLDTRDKAFTQTEMLEKLAQSFNISTECIGIQPAESPRGCIQYLTHKGKNDRWKTQYSANEIHTNNWEEIKPLYLNDFEVMQEALTMEELANMRDANFLKSYLTTWKEIKKAQAQDTETLAYIVDLYEKAFDKLAMTIWEKDYKAVVDPAAAIKKARAILSDLEDTLIHLRERQKHKSADWLK